MYNVPVVPHRTVHQREWWVGAWVGHVDWKSGKKGTAHLQMTFRLTIMLSFPASLILFITSSLSLSPLFSSLCLLVLIASSLIVLQFLFNTDFFCLTHVTEKQMWKCGLECDLNHLMHKMRKRQMSDVPDKEPQVDSMDFFFLLQW